MPQVLPAYCQDSWTLLVHFTKASRIENDQRHDRLTKHVRVCLGELPNEAIDF